MPELDLSFLQRTDPRMAIQPEVRAALLASERSDRFQLRTLFSGAFADPSAFLRDEPVQRAFLELVGHDRALQLMRTYRLFGAVREASLSTMLDVGGQPLNAVLAFSKDQLRERGVDIDPQSIPQIIRRLREVAYERREIGLPRNILTSVRVDFVQGHVEITDKGYGEELDLDRVVFPDVRPVQQDESLDVHAMFAPDIGVRMLGERQLAIVANEILRVISRMGGEERRVHAWPYRRSIEALIHAYGNADADATPFIELTLDQLVHEGVLADGQGHLIVATYHDYLLSHLDHKLQVLAGVAPNRSGEETIDGLMSSLMLALDSSAKPIEFRDDTALADAFLSSRAHLKNFLGKTETLNVIRGVVREYLQLYDDKGLVWFLGQTLPLIALFSDTDSLHQNGINVVQAFSPNAHYGWDSYVTVMEQVRSIIDPCWDDPDGGERMSVVGADIPMPANPLGFGVSHGPSIKNYTTPCISGAMLMTG